MPENKQTLSDSFPTVDSDAYLAVRDQLAAYSNDIIFNEAKALEIAKESLEKFDKCRDRFQTS
jgi:hypothetical protein